MNQPTQKIYEVKATRENETDKKNPNESRQFLGMTLINISARSATH